MRAGLAAWKRYRTAHKLRHTRAALLTAKVISGGGWAAARSALCAKGCESRARSLVSVTVEDKSVTEEEFAADINGC